MKLSVVIPTRWDHNLKNIVECLVSQTFKDFEVIFVVDRKIENLDLWLAENPFLQHTMFRCITDANPGYRIHNNASYNRNIGIKHAKGEFIQLMDDDEWFETDYLENSLKLWDNYHRMIKKDFVLTPTLMYRKTWIIQNQGFTHFSYRLSRPIPQILWNKQRAYIQMYSWNSLLAPAHIFKEILFDENLDFVYEDLDFSLRIHRAGYPIIVLRDLRIYHMEREKTKLEHARVANEYSAYRKAKHRMIFVNKYGTFSDKIKFYLLGFLGQPLWLIIKIFLYAPWKQKTSLFRALWKWTVDWLCNKKRG